MEVVGFSTVGPRSESELPHTQVGPYQFQEQKASRPESRVAKINLSALGGGSPLLRSLSLQRCVEHMVLSDFAGSTIPAQPRRGGAAQEGFKHLSVLTRDHLGVGHKLGLPPDLSPSVLQQATGTTQVTGQGTGEVPGGTDVTSIDTDRPHAADLSAQLGTVLSSLQKGSLRALTLTLLSPFPAPFTSAIAPLAEGGQLACLDALPTMLSQAEQWENLQSVTIQLPGFDSALGAAVSVFLAHPQSNIKSLSLNLIPAPGVAAPAFPVIPESVTAASSSEGRSFTSMADESDPIYASVVALLEGLRSCKSLSSLQLSGIPGESTLSSAGASIGAKSAEAAREALQTNSMWRHIPAVGGGGHARDASMGAGLEGQSHTQGSQRALQLVFNGQCSTIQV